MKKYLIFVFIMSSTFNFLFAQKVPSWFDHSDAVYPSEFYITAQGEGKSLDEAEAECISKISLYFDTTAEITNIALKNYSEVEGKNYSFSSKTEISEYAKINSQSEFFGVQFEKPFSARGVYYAFAYIDRASAFDVYKQRIKLNSGTLEGLLLIAEDYNNPIYGIEAAKKGVPIADITEEQIKMARKVKKTTENQFLEAENLCKRIKTAFEICKTNLVFQIDVKNDFDGMIKRTVGKLLETEGYNISETNGVCVIPVEITINEENLPAGDFLYGGIEIGVKTGTGEKVFSWSRNIPKTGAPKGRVQIAKKLLYQKIQKEIEENFIKEFKEKIKL